jgi:uncharacterized membrane protein
MSIVYDLLLWLHIIAFIVGGANSVAMPVIGARIAGAGPETRPVLFELGNRLAQFGKVAMVVLLVSGPAMMAMRYGGLAEVSPWFWVKMALIVVMLVTIVISGINFKKAQRGVAGAAHTAEAAGKVTALAFLGVLLAAVLAFS